MEQPHGILRLSNELLKDVLDYLEPQPEKFVNVDRRAYLSVESFKRPTLPYPLLEKEEVKKDGQEDHRTDVDRFREVCKRFSELGAPRKFGRVVVRFTPAGFQRLDNISSLTRLAKHTRNFTYIVRSFYVEGQENVREWLRDINSSKLKVSEHLHRLEDQNRLVQSGDDLASLKRAMAAFTSLQHVKILKVQDETERDLLQFIKDRRLGHLVSLDWKPACVHAIKTLGTALLESNSPFNRFSGPQINPDSILMLKETPQPTISALALRLTCLEVHFDATRYVNLEMRELSSVFRALFAAAKNVEAVHIGFPSVLPLDLGLEEIFHNVHWTKLRAFGIQAWRLNSQEIIDIARRHRRTLRGLRLRDVLLRDGSMWKDVLAMLREEMDNLEWVSLRRIDYSNHFDDELGNGAEISDIQSFPNSDSDDEDMFGAYNSDGHLDDQSDLGEESDDDMGSSNDDHGPMANQLELSPDTTVSSKSLDERLKSFDDQTAEELEDNGIKVVYQQRKSWEEWVVSKPRSNGLCRRYHRQVYSWETPF